MALPQVFITPEIDPRLAVKLKDIVKRHNVRDLFCFVVLSGGGGVFFFVLL